MMQQVGAPSPVTTVKSTCEICPIEESVKPEIVTNVPQESTKTPEVATKNSNPETQAQIAKTSKFHIIVASSPTEENANLAIKELSSKAQFDYMKVEGNGRFRISAGTYNTQEEAQTALSGIQQAFPDAWILKR